jgi:hypothetical protein
LEDHQTDGKFATMTPNAPAVAAVTSTAVLTKVGDGKASLQPRLPSKFLHLWTISIFGFIQTSESSRGAGSFLRARTFEITLAEHALGEHFGAAGPYIRVKAYRR